MSSKTNKHEMVENEYINLMEAMLRTTTDAIVVTDIHSGKIIMFNDAACRNLGYTRDEFQCLSVKEIEVNYSQEDIMSEIEAVVEKGSSQFVSRQRRKDGEIRDVSVQLRLISHGERKFIFGIWQDVTEHYARINEQKALAEKNKLFSKLISEISTIESGINGEVTAFAREMTELLAAKLEIDKVSFWEFKEDHKYLKCLDMYDRACRAHSEGLVVSKQDFPGYFEELQKNRFLQINCESEEPALKSFFESYMEPQGISSIIDCSVCFNGRILGIIGFAQTTGKTDLSFDDAVFLGQVANQVEIAFINRKRLK